jgi:hypothetical protein
MYYSELLVSSNNKSKTSWNIIMSETGKATSKVHTPSGFKLGKKKNIHINQAAEAFNNFFLNVVEELNTEQANIESAIFLLNKCFLMVFLK